MKERPILFSSAMVRAILDGSKTQTRRTIRVTPCAVRDVAWAYDDRWRFGSVDGESFVVVRCPYGVPGDRLYVKERHEFITLPGGALGILYHADKAEVAATDNRAYDPPRHRGRPSIHMPKWASRITLEVVDVRVERLQDISEADAIAEGWKKQPERSTDPEVHWDAARDWYCDLWCSLNGAQSWADNPFVFVVAFRRVT